MGASRRRANAALGFAVDLCPPPTDADEKETPVGKKFRRFAFEGMADELENPSKDKQSQRIRPQAMKEDANEKKQNREHDGRDAERVADTIHGMLMAGGVLRDPLLAGAVA